MNILAFLLVYHDFFSVPLLLTNCLSKHADKYLKKFQSNQLVKQSDISE